MIIVIFITFLLTTKPIHRVQEIELDESVSARKRQNRDTKRKKYKGHSNEIYKRASDSHINEEIP